MQGSDCSNVPRYSFENDISGQLFCWLIESGQVDLPPMIEQAIQDEPDANGWVKRVAEALKVKIGRNWAPAPLPATESPAGNTPPSPKAPAYTIWFRPSPSKKIKFKEVARALLTFAGRLPPAVG
jgi:hypothetical protein